MKLYYSPGACSLAAHIALEILGQPYETEAVSLRTKQTATGQDYQTVNPNGYVPALVLDGGEVLTELPAILQFLADLAPEKQLAPPVGHLDRYRMQGWMNFLGTELHRSVFTPLFHPTIPAEWREVCLANLQRRLSYLDATMAGREYLLDSGLSVADLYLFVVLGFARYLKYDLAPWSHLVAFQARMMALPAVQAAMKAEGLL